MHLNQELAMSESSQQHQPHDGIPLNQLTSADIGSSAASGPADGAGHEAFISDEPFRGLPGSGSRGPDAEVLLLEALQKPQSGQNGQNSQNGQKGQKGQTEATAAGAEGCESNHFVVESSSNAGTVSTMCSEPFSEHYDTRL